MNYEKFIPKLPTIATPIGWGIDKITLEPMTMEINGTAGKPFSAVGFFWNKLLGSGRSIFWRYQTWGFRVDRRYKETAKQTLDAATIITHRILDYYEIQCSYAQINSSMPA